MGKIEWQLSATIEVCIKTRSHPASLPFKGLVTEHRGARGLWERDCSSTTPWWLTRGRVRREFAPEMLAM